MLERMGLEKKAAQWKAFELWPRIVGEAIAKVSRPLYVMDGVLYVAASSSAWANELDFHKVEILSRLRAHLGEKNLKEVRFRSSAFKVEKSEECERKKPRLHPSEKENIVELSREIPGEKLRKAFERLVTKGLLLEKEEDR